MSIIDARCHDRQLTDALNPKPGSHQPVERREGERERESRVGKLPWAPRRLGTSSSLIHQNVLFKKIFFLFILRGPTRMFPPVPLWLSTGLDLTDTGRGLKTAATGLYLFTNIAPLLGCLYSYIGYRHTIF